MALLLRQSRCEWCTGDPLYIAYHDHEWGVPVREDRKLFEFLTLEGAQAGLSWLIVLRRREGYRKAFDGFSVEKVARYGKGKIKKLLADPGIIRNRLKVESSIDNAKAFMEIQEKFGRFSDYIWKFVDGKPIRNHWKSIKELPATTKISDAMSQDLKSKGFRFVGSTICYAFMQATGMVNDHRTSCFRYRQVYE